MWGMINNKRDKGEKGYWFLDLLSITYYISFLISVFLLMFFNKFMKNDLVLFFLEEEIYLERLVE